MLHQDLSPSSPYSTRPRQIYTGHLIKEVRQWEDLLVARTTNSDLLMARLELLTEEEAWQPLVTGLTVVGFDISQAGELWVVGRSTRELAGTTQFLLSSDWSWSLSPSWSELTCPHLLSPPLCRPVLLPASRLWLTSGVSTCLLAHLQPVSTFLWSRLDISSLLSSRLQSGQTTVLQAGGKEAYSGQLLLQVTDKTRHQSLLQLDISRRTLVSVSPPPGQQVAQVSVVPGHLVVLTESGSVYLQTSQPGKWRTLDTADQLGGLRLVSISLAEAGQVWAVDQLGQVYMRPPDRVPPVWLALDREREVEEDLGEGGRMVEVVCSSGGRMVWARDSRQGVWARVGVYPDLPLGTGWVPVTGLAITRLALSRRSVWALGLSGQVYRRTGLSDTHWLGDSWQCCNSPVVVLDLSVGQCDSVWSLDQAGIIRQLEVRETEGCPPHSLTQEDTDWTIIH